MIIIVMTMVLIVILSYYDKNKNSCEQAGGDFSSKYAKCYKEIDGKYYTGIVREIDGKYIFIINGG